MASTAYTQTLWQLGPTGAGGSFLGPAVPAGELWVIRDVTLVSPGGPGIIQSTAPAQLYVNAIPVAATPNQGTLQGCTFRFEDVRQVVAVTDTWGFSAQAPGWLVRVGGYQLTAP